MFEYDFMERTLRMILLVCFVYLAFHSVPWFLAVAGFQVALAAFVTWKGRRNEVQDGNS